MNYLRLIKRLRERATERRQLLSADTVAAMLDELADAFEHTIKATHEQELKETLNTEKP